MTLDGVLCRVRPLLLTIANGVTFGAGIPIAPLAQVDDGAFDVIVVERGRWRALGLLRSLMAGEHLRSFAVSHHRVRQLRLATEIAWASSEEILVEADGELVGVLPIEVRVEHQALAVHVGSRPACGSVR
jgi:diacylglycerol kinase (ATP)